VEAGVGGTEGPHPIPVQGQTGLSTATTAGKLPTQAVRFSCPVTAVLTCLHAGRL
jgi:hypothetical protein